MLKMCMIADVINIMRSVMEATGNPASIGMQTMKSTRCVPVAARKPIMTEHIRQGGYMWAMYCSLRPLREKQ